MKKFIDRLIVTTPETIKSLIENGIFPAELSDYVSPRNIRLINFQLQQAFESHTTKDQTFLIEVSLELDPHDAVSEILEQASSSCVSKIDPRNIRVIYTFSEKGQRIINSNMGKQLKVPIVVDPGKFYLHSMVKDISQQPAQVSSKQVKRDNSGDLTKETDREFGSYADISKKLKPETAHNNRGATQNPPQPDLHSNDLLLRLSNKEEHKSFLRSAFARAKSSILITSYSIETQCFERLDLYSLIIQARKRGIKIYIYFSDRKAIEEEVFEFLNHYGVNVDQMITHSKILVVDESIVAVGSFNWLSGVSEAYPEACDGTIVFQNHQNCRLYKDDIWTHIVRYRNIQFGNDAQTNKFNRDEDNFMAVEYSVIDDSCITYLPTLIQQRNYLIEALNDAAESIIICSPFISIQGEFINDFNHRTLAELSRREVHVIFVCDANCKGIDEFIDFLNRLDSPYVHLVLTANFHLKTIIVDDKEMCEGSFNWLSAVRDEESEYHNHEAVVVVTGDKALPLVEHFHNSPVGQAIQSYFAQLSSDDEMQNAEVEEYEEEGSSSHYSY